mmetsp:Transcript_14036/g.21539  ORF Transcript_14036/g.21539 Transcript_14036/m.21539 type:complete len:233 (+) Transcript_14036:710-1408(+)
MDAACGKALAAQNVLNVVGRALGLDKDQNQALFNGEQKVHEDIELVRILDKFHHLRHILAGTAHTTNGDEDVIHHKIAGHALHLHGEGGAKHHSLATIHGGGHALGLHNAANLRLESHVQHTVCLVQDQELNVLQTDAATLHQVHQTARSGNEQVASTLFQIPQLFAHVRSSIHHHTADTGAVGKLARLLINLRGQLTRGGKHQGLGKRLSGSRIISTGIPSLLAHTHNHGK